MIEQATIKYCKRCADMGREATHPLTAFNKNKSMPDGLGFYCRQCEHERTSLYRVRNADAIRQRTRVAALSPEQRAYRQTKALEMYHRHKEEHRDEARERSRRYYGERRDTPEQKLKNKLHNERYYTQHKAKAHAAHRDYQHRKQILTTLLVWTLQSPNRLQVFPTLYATFSQAVYVRSTKSEDTSA